MRQLVNILLVIGILVSCNNPSTMTTDKFKPFVPPISYTEAGIRSDDLLKKMTIDEKIDLIGGHNVFFIRGFEKYHIPQLYLSDATQGVHIRKV